MTTDSTRPAASSTASSTEGEHFLCDDWFDPLQSGVRTRIRGFIEELLEAELDAALGRARYERGRVEAGGCARGGVGTRHRRWPACGRMFPSSAARFTSTATCWRTRPSGCTRKSRPTTRT